MLYITGVFENIIAESESFLLRQHLRGRTKMNRHFSLRWLILSENLQLKPEAEENYGADYFPV